MLIKGGDFLVTPPHFIFPYHIKYCHAYLHLPSQSLCLFEPSLSKLCSSYIPIGSNVIPVNSKFLCLSFLGCCCSFCFVCFSLSLPYLYIIPLNLPGKEATRFSFNYVYTRELGIIVILSCYVVSSLLLL